MRFPEITSQMTDELLQCRRAADRDHQLPFGHDASGHVV